MERKLVSIRNLRVSYGGHVALTDADLDIYTDDFIGIIGPNGGGKTTLVKSILGTIPYKGTIEYMDGLTDSHGNKAIGYLPQQNDFDPKFPILIKDVILSGLQNEKRFFRRYSNEDRRKAFELMGSVGIEEIANKTMSEISGGQMQRALLCRALISNPKMLILDEPANFVDNKFEKELYELLKSLNGRMAIVMVLHDLGTITSVVKTIVCVNKHVHRHDSNVITAEQLHNYDCPLQLVYYGEIPHTVLKHH